LNASGLFVCAVVTQRSCVTKRNDRFDGKDNFFYVLVIVATLAVTNIGFLIELVEYASAFSDDAEQAGEASANAPASAIYLAQAGEKK
jgi:hypothetical protein